MGKKDYSKNVNWNAPGGSLHTKPGKKDAFEFLSLKKMFTSSFSVLPFLSIPICIFFFSSWHHHRHDRFLIMLLCQCHLVFMPSGMNECLLNNIMKNDNSEKRQKCIFSGWIWFLLLLLWDAIGLFDDNLDIFSQNLASLFREIHIHILFRKNTLIGLRYYIETTLCASISVVLWYKNKWWQVTTGSHSHCPLYCRFFFLSFFARLLTF